MQIRTSEQSITQAFWGSVDFQIKNKKDLQYAQSTYLTQDTYPTHPPEMSTNVDAHGVVTMFAAYALCDDVDSQQTFAENTKVVTSQYCPINMPGKHFIMYDTYIIGIAAS